MKNHSFHVYYILKFCYIFVYLAMYKLFVNIIKYINFYRLLSALVCVNPGAECRVPTKQENINI